MIGYIEHCTGQMIGETDLINQGSIMIMFFPQE